jgi:hypothetical protein
MSTDAAKAVVRRNSEEVQGRGNFDVFDELFADDFVDHTPQPNMIPNKEGYGTSTARSVRRFRTSMQRSIGKPPTGNW